MKLKRDFYRRDDVVAISRELLGKVLVTHFDGEHTAAIITETEAYMGAVDKASHAYNNRRTRRTEIIFGEAGFVYVYLCYGIHHLFNVVTNVPEIPHAVLVRAIYPVDGVDIMLKRRKKEKFNARYFGGPGTSAEALGLKTSHTGIDLCGDEIWIEDRGIFVKDEQVQIGPRIGVDYAEEDALLPYRFVYHHKE